MSADREIAQKALHLDFRTFEWSSENNTLPTIEQVAAVLADHPNS